MISETARRAPAISPAFWNSAILTCFSVPSTGFVAVTVCGSSGRLNPEALVEDRIARHVDPEREVVLHRITNLHQPIREPVPEAVPIEHGHHDVDVRLELNQSFARIGDRAFAHAGKRDAVALLERARQR